MRPPPVTSTSVSEWKTSKWAREHDWDWASEPHLAGQGEFAAKKAAALPPRFFYHVLRSFIVDADDPSGNTVQVSYTHYTDIGRDLLNAFRTPRPFADYLRKSAAPPSLVTQMFRALRDQALIVPADADEPPHWRAVLQAALCLHGNFQSDDEILGAIELLATRPPKVFVEIGTAWGGILFCWAQVAHPEAHLLSVDLPGGVGGGGYTAHHVRHLQQFCQPSQRLSSVLGDSGSQQVVDEVRRLTDGETVDVLFIDGDHTYEGVKRDFELYSPLVETGGLIMLHDSCPRRTTRSALKWTASGRNSSLATKPRSSSQTRNKRDVASAYCTSDAHRVVMVVPTPGSALWHGSAAAWGAVPGAAGGPIDAGWSG